MLRPAARGVPAAELEHQIRTIARDFFGRGHAARPRRIEHRLRLRVRAGLGERGFEAVVRDAATDGMEVIVTFFQRPEKIIKGPDPVRRKRTAGRSGEFFHVGVEHRRSTHGEGFVGTEGRVNPGL